MKTNESDDQWKIRIIQPISRLGFRKKLTILVAAFAFDKKYHAKKVHRKLSFSLTSQSKEKKLAYL